MLSWLTAAMRISVLGPPLARSGEQLSDGQDIWKAAAGRLSESRQDPRTSGETCLMSQFGFIAGVQLMDLTQTRGDSLYGHCKNCYESRAWL